MSPYRVGTDGHVLAQVALFDIIFGEEPVLSLFVLSAPSLLRKSHATSFLGTFERRVMPEAMSIEVATAPERLGA